jgi:transposase
VERTFAWLGRCRKLAKDFEATIASAVAWALVVSRVASQELEIKWNHFESDT